MDIIEKIKNAISKYQNSNVETSQPSLEEILGRNRRQPTEDELLYGSMRQGYTDEQMMEAILSVYDPSGIAGRIKNISKIIKANRRSGPKQTLDPATDTGRTLREINKVDKTLKTDKISGQQLRQDIFDAAEELSDENAAKVIELLKNIQ
tara:strand:- start:185 stop:634 length:450 start_codon:yes stop_codon:yes gene_type:complete